MFNEEEPESSEMDFATEIESGLRPLRRLHQLAGEIERGLDRDDLELVCQAAALLGPTMTQWNEVHENLPISAGESAQLAVETRQVLTRCEAGLLQIMGLMSEELRRMRQGRRSLLILNPPSTQISRLNDLH